MVPTHSFHNRGVGNPSTSPQKAAITQGDPPPSPPQPCPEHVGAGIGCRGSVSETLMTQRGLWRTDVSAGRRQKSQMRLRKKRGAGLGSAHHLALPRLLLFGSVLHTALHLGGAPGAAGTEDHTLEVSYILPPNAKTQGVGRTPLL